MKDEFEKWLGEEIKKQREFVSNNDIERDSLATLKDAQDKYRSLKSKQGEEKSTAPASLVEELREWMNKEIYDQDTDGNPVIVNMGFATAQSDVLEILSHHEQRTEVVLAEGVFHSADDWEVYFEPKNKPFIRCNCGLIKIDGKRGKLIFVEEP